MFASCNKDDITDPTPIGIPNFTDEIFTGELRLNDYNHHWFPNENESEIHFVNNFGHRITCSSSKVTRERYIVNYLSVYGNYSQLYYYILKENEELYYNCSGYPLNITLTRDIYSRVPYSLHFKDYGSLMNDDWEWLDYAHEYFCIKINDDNFEIPFNGERYRYKDGDLKFYDSLTISSTVYYNVFNCRFKEPAYSQGQNRISEFYYDTIHGILGFNLLNNETWVKD